MPTNQSLAFRFHGTFGVQSGFGHRDLGPSVLEVFHRASSADIVLRWRRAAGAPEVVGLGNDVPNWHAQGSDVWEAFGVGDEVVFAIGHPAGLAGVTPQSLIFTGITALDRIHEDQRELPSPELDLRIPTVTQGNAAHENWLRIGHDHDQSSPAFAYAYQLAIPMPVGFGRFDDQNRNRWLPLGGQHDANEADKTLVQSPDLIFSPRIGGRAGIKQDMADRRTRFGDLVLQHYGSGKADVSLDPYLELGNAQLVRPAGTNRPALLKKGIVQGPSRDRWPSASDEAAHNRIVIGPLRQRAKSIGLRVETRAQIGPHSSGTPVIDFEEQLDRRISANSKPVTVKAVFEVEASDEALATGGAYDCAAELMLEFQTDPRKSSDPLLVRAADRWMAGERTSLEETRAQPQSFLPSLAIPGWQRVVGVGARVAVRGRMSGGDAGLPEFFIDPAHGTAPPVSLTLQEGKSVSLRVNFPGVHIGGNGVGDTSNSRHLFHVALANDPNVLARDPVRSEVQFTLQNDDDRGDETHGSAHHAQPLRAQLGSLDLRGVGAADGKGVKLFASSGKETKGHLTLRPCVEKDARHELELLLKIALSDARPVASDLPHGDRNPLRRDWLVPVQRLLPDADIEPRFELEIIEKIGPEEDHHLVANLFDAAAEAGRGFDDVLITRAPFGMMRLKRPAFDTLGSDASGNVATYDSDKRTWKFTSGGDLVPVTFPASATGESMDKSGRRTISDGAAGGDSSDGPFVRSRLSGPSTLWVDTTGRGRNFRTPEHNVRELFGRWEEEGPGTELAGFVTELVYGVETAWQRSRNTTALTTNVRATETGTLMGRLVSERTSLDPGESELSDRMPHLLRAIAERPQHLETVRRIEGRLTDYGPAAFAEGLTFAGRATAVVAPPLNGMLSEDAPDASDYVPKVAEHGLDGGAYWAIEQRAFASEVLANPNSTEGSVDSFTVGPFGAGGEQVARFVNGALAVITVSRLGRLESLRVEVKGRIGAFYHRAKHVVVYRRTTAASDQFEGLGGTSERPIMRKVEEFIDLEEPVRAYPDRSNVDPRTIGPFRELRFGARRINVDSAWAEDVGEAGWRIPLWNRLAGSERPVVYPMPSITAAFQGEDVERLTLQELCDPGKLCFYTNVAFAKSEQQTDLWPAVHGIDGFDAKDFDGWMRQQDASALGSEKATSARRPAASRFIPAAGAFTHCLAESSALTKVNESRGDRPVFAALESFTFMRGGGRKTSHKGDATKTKEKLLDLPGEIETFIGAFPAEPGADILKKLKAEWEAFLANAGSVADAGVEGLVNDTKAKFEALAKEAASLSGQALADLEKELLGDKWKSFREATEAFDLLKKIAESDEKDCHKLQDQALASIRAKKMLVLERLSGLQGQLLAGLEQAASKDELLDRLKEEEGRAIGIANEAVGRLDADIGNIAAYVADARALVHDWGVDLDRAYRIGLERVASFRQAYETDKPWSPSRLDKAQQALEAQLANLKGEASAAVSQTRQRLASEIAGRAADVTVLIDRSLRAAKAELESGNPVSKVAIAMLTADPEKYEELLDAVPVDTVASIAERLQAAIDGGNLIADHKEIIGDLKAEFERLGEEVATLRAKANALSNKEAQKKLKEELEKLAADAQKQIEQIEGDAQDAVEALEAELQADLKKVTDDLGEKSESLFIAVQNLEELAVFDAMVDGAERWISERAGKVHEKVSGALEEASTWLGKVSEEFTEARKGLKEGLQDALNTKVIEPVFTEVRELIDPVGDDLNAANGEIRAGIDRVNARLTEKIDVLESVATNIADRLTKLCKALVRRKQALLEALKGAQKWLEARIRAYIEKLEDFSKVTADELRAWLEGGGDLLKGLTNEAFELAEGMLNAAVRAAERAAREISEFGEELADGIGRVIAAGAKIPDIGNLGINTDRITAFFKDLVDDIDVSRVFSSLGGVGDGLGAFNFDMPVVGLGGGFDLPDLNLPDIDFPDINFEDLLPNIAGINFKDIVPDFGRAGNSLKDLKKYVKITHDIDKRAKTAWAKAELDIPFPKRAKLFGFGPFTLFLKKPDLTAWVRIEASSKTKEVTTTEHGQIKTDMEAVVAGQPMLTLRDVLIVYTKDGGLDFDIDPAKIRLNPSFQFVQDIIEGLGIDFGDNGLKLLKDGDGIPVGVEHKLTLPVPDANAGTSGIVGLLIANSFQLKAYPDFFIRNQFNLSTRDKPFIFSIFIIGGTGFVQLDVDHLPSDQRTTIVVTAGVGGSAALAFSFGPISGGVAITLMIILTYRKYIGYPDDRANEGLTVAVELAILGHVSLWGIATIFLRLALSMTYHESGRIDATGRLKATLRVSRFFKLSYSTTVRYQLRNGKSVTKRQSSTQVEVDDDLRKRAENFKKSRAKLS